MPDRYAVFGNPIAHSKSPWIHARFAAETGEDIAYEAILAPNDGFASSVRVFIEQGGRGANVTVPFKEDACRLANRLSDRAQLAGAVNTLRFDSDGIFGDNTDGTGLLRDLQNNLGADLNNKRVLLLGAGGAARGAVPALLDARPASLVIANRTPERAATLAGRFQYLGPIKACTFETLTDAPAPFDLIINATAASLAGDIPPVPAQAFAKGALAYDMMYAARDTAFLAHVRTLSTTRNLSLRCADGLGMLVEQAAEAFLLWRGKRPATPAVLSALRARLQTESSALAMPASQRT